MTGYMLDSNICIYLMSGRFPELDRRVAAEDELYLSSIAYGELCFGVEHADRVDRNRRNLDLLIEQLRIVPFDRTAAAHYGEIRAHFERLGTPCGANDMLIGAHARSLGLTLVTNNRREFDRMPRLEVENWV
jgi:tRNA(fMet)-specific endonuclease VapC